MAWSLPDDAVLGILADRPDGEPLSEALLSDTLELWGAGNALAPGGRRVVVFGPVDAGPWFDSHVQAAFALQPQQGDDPGARIDAFVAGEIEEGAGRVVVMTADAPTLDPNFVISAFLLLESKDVVLGPSTDGGLYLFACRTTVTGLLAGSTNVDSIIDRLRDTGKSLAVLPPWYAVRTEADSHMLRGHLRALRRSGMAPGLPRLERWAGLKEFAE